MNPTNNFFIGADSPMNNLDDLEAQIQRLQALKNQMQGYSHQRKNSSIWVTIEGEINSLTEDQKSKLMKNETYIEKNNKLQNMIQAEILNIIVPRLESVDSGRAVLNEVLEAVKTIKASIIKESNLEIELFSKFREFSKNNPGLTYDDFLKHINHD